MRKKEIVVSVCLVGICMLMTAAKAPVKKEIGYWNLDKISGGKFFDYKSNKWNGVVKDVKTVKSLKGYGLKFDGQTGRADIAMDLKTLGPKALTVTGWILPSPATTGYAAVFNCGNNGGMYIRMHGPSVLTINCGVVWHAVRGNGIIAGQWNHFAACYDGAKATLYINGQKAGEKEINRMMQLDKDIKIGYRLDYIKDVPNPIQTETFKGVIDDIHLYNYILDEKRIVKEYKQYEKRLEPKK